MLLGLLMTWSLWITLLAVLVLVICEATESPVLAAFTVLVALTLYQLVGGVDVLGYIKNNPLSLLKWSGIYLTVGVVWGTFKWWLFAHKQLDVLKELKAQFLTSHKISGDKIPDDLKKEWLNKTDHLYDLPPKVQRHKSRIIRWMAYWPTNVLWTVMDDFLRRIYTVIYNKISSTLQKISNSVFAGELD